MLELAALLELLELELEELELISELALETAAELGVLLPPDELPPQPVRAQSVSK